MSRTHLVIGDSHSKPNVSNRRYDWAGMLVAEVKPDVIINIGDHADMESLCSYDRGTKGFEGRRYKKDIAAAVDANERMEHYGGQAWKDAERIMCIGNHEDRIARATSADAALDGVLSVEDLEYDRFYDRVGSFLEPVVCDGIYYSHYFTSGIMGRPIGGEHPAYQLLAKKHVSCTAGHSHMLDSCVRTDPTGRVIRGLVAGCYFEHNEQYAGVANTMYWRGLVLKKDVSKGNYDYEELSLDFIRREYNG